MLILSRKLGEVICIGDDVTITVTDIHANKVRLAFSAPRDIIIHRKEVYDAINEQKAAP
ncbi:hypothetical protein LCGC14_2089700 [marine sediment metagenome]|uniref:Carbon storage regulator n=1 Tax=marine sediment metagenome TaxID=412755 RepID=A0A0F9EDD4_9ZZZZ